jgi:hypothetical protein
VAHMTRRFHAGHARLASQDLSTVVSPSPPRPAAASRMSVMEETSESLIPSSCPSSFSDILAADTTRSRTQSMSPSSEFSPSSRSSASVSFRSPPSRLDSVEKESPMHNRHLNSVNLSTQSFSFGSSPSQQELLQIIQKQQNELEELQGLILTTDRSSASQISSPLASVAPSPNFRAESSFADASHASMPTLSTQTEVSFLPGHIC